MNSVLGRRAALMDSQRRVLERIATGAPLEDVLHTLVRLIEEQSEDMHCAVLLADAGQTRLSFAAAPSLPREFRAGVQPFLVFGPDACPCGAAAHRREPVYVRDVATDPRWEHYRDVAARAGVRAIWSTPIVSDDSRVLGTFAMSYGEPRLPSEEHAQLIDMAVQMARVAIEAKEDDELLQLVFDKSDRPLVVTDVEGRIARANEAFARQLGYAPADLRGKPLAEISAGKDGAGQRRYRTREGTTLWARERSSLRCDAAGVPRYVVTQIHSVSVEDPLGSLSAREREVLDLVVEGRTSKHIAARLGISAASVDTYRRRIIVKLGIESVPGLVRFAIRHGIASA